MDTNDPDRVLRGLEDASSTPTVNELRRQQQREIAHIGLGTAGQTKGAALGWLAGALVGGLILLAIGMVTSDATVVRVVMAIVGAAFGGVAGLVFGGGRGPEVTDETIGADGHPETEQ